MVRAMWKVDISKELRKSLARDFAKRMRREDDVDVIKTLEKGEEPLEDARPKVSEPEEIEEMTRNADNQDTRGTIRKERESFQRTKKRKSEEKSISPLLLAEIRATIAAALSTVEPAISNTFPSAKTNLVLHSPSNNSEALLSHVVQSIAHELGADVVVLQAQDLAQLAGDYLGEGPEPSPNSIRSLGYDTYNKFTPDLAADFEELGKEESFEDEQEADGQPVPEFSRVRPAIVKMHFVLKGLNALKDISQNLKPSQLTNSQPELGGATLTPQSARAQSPQEVQLEDLKLSTLLEALVDSNELKRNRASSIAGTSSPVMLSSSAAPVRGRSAEKSKPIEPDFFDFSLSSAGTGPELDFTSALPPTARDGFMFTMNNGLPFRQPQVPPKPKIILVKDIGELNATHHGSRIMQKLEDIVRKQRTAGESVMLLGTTCSLDLMPELSSAGVQGLQSQGESSCFRTIFVSPGNIQDDDTFDMMMSARARVLEKNSSEAEKRKFRHINLRHLQDMLQSLDPAACTNLADVAQNPEQLRQFGPIFPESAFWTVLTYDEVHRIALTALGLHRLDSTNVQLSWSHVALAMGLLKASDEVKFIYAKAKASEQEHKLKEFREQIDKLRVSLGQEPLRQGRESRDKSSKPGDYALKQQRDLNRIKTNASSHERKLMHGIVNPDQIKTTFDQVHVPKETVEAIRTLTSMSLLRPDAFNYGVLATEKISGTLLYGPPGTGKTMLAKAVAKESGSAVLEVSGSQIMDKYVGEGEKNVAAIFSLARKLSPCIVFLDEADAIFGSRDTSRERTAHRDILNQFLKEWDGLNDVSVFVMVATNRPFDMDDAVIRRLPRRLLVDLPTQEDRKKILEIHLRGEQLDTSVDLEDLANRTPLYSGSDLKNVAVFAALACVREENEQAALAAAKAVVEASQSEHDNTVESTSSDHQPQPQSTPTLVQGQKYDFPERRTLNSRHFDKALQEVSASISEDMHSLNAIKKFDEQYGDRKGRKKKKTYGFGVNAEHNESAARVRT